MFSLIISVIAIAVIVVLAGAALYYGGDSFNQGTVKSEVAKYKNEANQIAGALVAYQVDQRGFRNHPNDPDQSNGFGWEDLVYGGYLKTLPSAIDSGSDVEMPWGIRNELIILPGIPDEVCLEANKLEGYPITEAGVEAIPTVGAGGAEAVGDGFVPNCNIPGLDPAIPCCFDPNT